MREIALDTETTGLSPKNGDRVVEIGCVELINHMPTGRTYQTYLNPQKMMDPSAEEVHGLSNDFLKDQPLFKEIVADFLEFISDSPLIIHNAEFDIGFLNAELQLASTSYPKIEDICEVEDSLVIARDKYPGQRNSLDALASRFDISGYDRTFHGALLDANILADVYMQLTGGQSKFEFISAFVNIKESIVARFGAIIPDPLATPQIFISSSPTIISSYATFGFVSVVIIADAILSQYILF